MESSQEFVKALVREARLETEAGADWRTCHDRKNTEMRAIVINVLRQDGFSQKSIGDLLGLKRSVVSKWVGKFEDFQDRSASFAIAYQYVDSRYCELKKNTFHGLSTESRSKKEKRTIFANEIKTPNTMTFIEMIEQNPDKFQETLKESLKLMSDLVEKLRGEPEVEEFLSAEFVLLNGAHFNADNAKAFVEPMEHLDPEGKSIVGELISIDEVKEVLPEEFHEVNLWDSYVGINEMLHRLARTSLERDMIIEAAIEYWLRDDNYPKPSEKVWKRLCQN